MRAFVTLLLIVVSSHPVFGQPEQNGPPTPDVANLKTEIIRLLHSDPNDAIMVIYQLFQDPAVRAMGGGTGGMGGLTQSTLRLAADPKTSSVVVRGSETEVQQVIDLLTELDQPGAAAVANRMASVNPMVIAWSDAQTLSKSALELLGLWCENRNVGLSPDVKNRQLLIITDVENVDEIASEIRDLLANVLLSKPTTPSPEIWRAMVAVIAETDQIESASIEIAPEVADAARQLGFKDPGIAGQLSLSVSRSSGIYTEGTTQLNLKSDEGSLPRLTALNFEGTWSDDQAANDDAGQMRVLLKVHGAVGVAENVMGGKRRVMTEQRDLIELKSDIIAKAGRTTLIGGGSTGTQNLVFTISWTKDEPSRSP